MPHIPFSNATGLTVDQMAAQLNGYKPGRIVPIYLTSDGGANLTIIYELVRKLEEHVTIVGTETGALALQAAAAAAADADAAR